MLACLILVTGLRIKRSIARRSSGCAGTLGSGSSWTTRRVAGGTSGSSRTTSSRIASRSTSRPTRVTTLSRTSTSRTCSSWTTSS
uniref:Uncharacterized protein n=1 Tax=Anopheles christyi TaxID=43041 RepID=A0A182KIK5_9DIPT